MAGKLLRVSAFDPPCSLSGSDDLTAGDGSEVLDMDIDEYGTFDGVTVSYDGMDDARTPFRRVLLSPAALRLRALSPVSLALTAESMMDSSVTLPSHSPSPPVRATIPPWWSSQASSPVQEHFSARHSPNPSSSAGSSILADFESRCSSPAGSILAGSAGSAPSTAGSAASSALPARPNWQRRASASSDSSGAILAAQRLGVGSPAGSSVPCSAFATPSPVLAQLAHPSASPFLAERGTGNANMFFLPRLTDCVRECDRPRPDVAGPGLFSIVHGLAPTGLSRWTSQSEEGCQ